MSPEPSMNTTELVFFIGVITLGIVVLGIDVFRGKRSVPATIFFIGVLLLGLADFYFVAFGGVGDSLSAWMVTHGMGDHGFWKFAVGCVCGHLFFPMRITKVDGQI